MKIYLAYEQKIWLLKERYEIIGLNQIRWITKLNFQLTFIGKLI